MIYAFKYNQNDHDLLTHQCRDNPRVGKDRPRKSSSLGTNLYQQHRMMTEAEKGQITTLSNMIHGIN